MRKLNSVIWFVLITVASSFATYFMPLPAESRALLVPVLLVFIPTLVCVPLAFITEGRDGLRQLFSAAHGGFKWLLIGAMIGALARVAVLVTGSVLDMPIKADFSAPGTMFILFATIPLAYFEELGWRRFALDRLLESRTPFESSLFLGLPWGLLHLTILLPGMMSEGAPAIAQVGTVILISVILTWVYVRSGGSVLAVTLLHGVQNGLVVLNRGLGIAEATWLMMGVYLVLAALFVFMDRRTFFTRVTKG